MINRVKQLYIAGLIDPPQFVVDNLCLLCIGGSIAYKCNITNSDIDLLGVTIPPKEYLYPTGIQGYDQFLKFDDYQKHHINDQGTEHDVKIYSIVRLFKLAEDGNPNILDLIMSDNDMVLFENDTGNLLRTHADKFLSKKCVSRYLGFAESHFRSMENRIKSGVYPEKRQHSYRQFGFDVKDIGHCLRCLMSLERILRDHKYSPGDNGKFIKSVRDGVYSYEECKDIRNKLIASIRELESSSLLRDEPDKGFVRNLLVQCVESSNV